MPARQKSKFEQWFSFSRHQRRFGAEKVYAGDQQLEQLKQNMIQGERITYTYGSEKDLNAHIENLKAEFIGQSELNHYHASLIVLIRRDVDATQNYQKFKTLWLAEQQFLLKSLNTRWLISACDTFIDYDQDATLQAIMMNAVVLINTIKAQETEALMCEHHYQENEAIKQKLQTERVALFDGTSALAVGTDDSLRNMRWRLDKVCGQHELGQIVIEIFDRLQQPENDNIYSRSKVRHTREKTRWW